MDGITAGQWWGEERVVRAYLKDLEVCGTLDVYWRCRASNVAVPSGRAGVSIPTNARHRHRHHEQPVNNV